MVREMIPWYLTAVYIIEAFLFGLTINVRTMCEVIQRKMRSEC